MVSHYSYFRQVKCRLGGRRDGGIDLHLSYLGEECAAAFISLGYLSVCFPPSLPSFLVIL